MDGRNPRRPEQRPDEFRVELVARTVSDHMTDQVFPEEGQVADHVEQLVANTLVGPAQGVVDRAIGTEDQQIGLGRATADARLS